MLTLDTNPDTEFRERTQSFFGIAKGSVLVGPYPVCWSGPNFSHYRVSTLICASTPVYASTLTYASMPVCASTVPVHASTVLTHASTGLARASSVFAHASTVLARASTVLVHVSMVLARTLTILGRFISIEVYGVHLVLNCYTRQGVINTLLWVCLPRT